MNAKTKGALIGPGTGAAVGGMIGNQTASAASSYLRAHGVSRGIKAVGRGGAIVPEEREDPALDSDPTVPHPAPEHGG